MDDQGPKTSNRRFLHGFRSPLKTVIEVHRLNASTDENTPLQLVRKLPSDLLDHGILVQLPLPSDIDENRVLDTIDPNKGVDGFHASNAGRFAAGGKAIVPCTPLGCLMLLRAYLADLSESNAVIVGRSNIVGKPVASLLFNQSRTVTIAHPHTRGLVSCIPQADIIVAAVGGPLVIRGEWIKPGATVIDVGINRIEDPGGCARLMDDVFASAVKVAGTKSPVPGGGGQ